MCGIWGREAFARIFRAFWGGKVFVCVIKEMRVNDVFYYNYTRMFCRNVSMPM